VLMFLQYVTNSRRDAGLSTPPPPSPDSATRRRLYPCVSQSWRAAPLRRLGHFSFLFFLLVSYAGCLEPRPPPLCSGENV